MDKLLHGELLADYRFKLLMDDVRKLSPLIPPYDPKTDNIEDMKYQSARHQMFQTVMSVLVPLDKP